MDFDDLFKPRLLLFLSADIVGSTRYKQDDKKEIPTWPILFSDFYRDFDTQFQKYLDEYRIKIQQDIPAPILWKTLGDELIYVAELKHNSHAYLLTCSFQEAIIEYNEICLCLLLSKLEDWRNVN